MNLERCIGKSILVLAATALLAALPVMAADSGSGDLFTGNYYCPFTDCPFPVDPFPVEPHPVMPGACRPLSGGFMLCPYPPFIIPPMDIITPVF